VSGPPVAEVRATASGRAGGRTRERATRAARSVADRVTRRPTLSAALIYAVLSVLMVVPGLVPGWTLSGSDLLFSNVPWLEERPETVRGLGANFELADSALVFQPFLQHTREVLPHLPLWNPEIGAGRPYLANAQSAIFSPFSWPAYVLPFWWSLGVIAALKLFLGALGAFVLGRLFGMRFGGALLTGLVFAFGTFFVLWLAWPLTNIFPLIPWLLVLAELAVRRPTPLVAAGLAGGVALTFFGGHPESSFHTIVMTALFFVVRLGWSVRDRPDRGRAMARPAAAFFGGCVVGSLIAAVMLVPLAELLLNSGDLERRQGEDPNSWPKKYLGALFLHDYWGRATQQSNIEPFMQVRGWYAGASTLMLATAALIIRPTAARVAVAVVGVLITMVIVGLDPVFWAVTRLPGFSTAHNQRMLIFVLLALAFLAGWGLDDLTGRRELSRRRRLLVLGSAALIFLVPFAWMTGAGTLTTRGLGTALEVAWGFVDPPRVNPLSPANDPFAVDVVHVSALLQWIPLAGLALAFLAWRLLPRRPLAAGAFVALVLAVLAVDLFRANMGFNPAIRTADAAPPETGAIRYLKSRTPNRFVGVSTDIAFQPLPADLAMDFDLFDARSYDYPAEKRYDALWRRNVVPGAPDFAQPVELASATPASIRGLSLLSVADFLQHPRGDPIDYPGMEVAYRGRDGVIYSNANALPRLFLVQRQQVVDGEEAALAAATAPGFNGRNVAVTERRLPGLAEAGTGAGESQGSARFVSYEAERVVAASDAPERSLLVLTDLHFPGWKVKVDGRPATLERVNYLTRGVVVPAGHHTVEFSYAPLSFRVGWILSVLGIVALLGLTVAGLWKRR
jgi:hypothetical protein